MWGEARGPSGLGGGGGDEGEGGDAEDAVVELDAGGVLRHVPQRRTEAQIHSLEEGVHILNPPPINIFFWK